MTAKKKKKEKKKTKDTQMKKEDANCLDSQIIQFFLQKISWNLKNLENNFKASGPNK